MKKKLLFLSMYPAPYRVNIIDRYRADFDVDAYFDAYTGDERDEKWFRQGNYRVLENEADAGVFRDLDLKSYDAALVFEYSTSKGVALALRSKRKRVPYFINCDGVILQKHGNLLKDALKRFLIKGAAGCFAGGEYAKKYFLRYGADEKRIFVHGFTELEEDDILPAPLSREEKAVIRQKLGLPVDKRIAVAVGRFIGLKRYEHLIRAWKDMPRDDVLLLIGGGNMEETYNRLIQEYRLDNVILKGFEPKSSLFEYYKACDVFVHPSSYEAWGLVVNEAMACGLPVAASDRCIAGLELIKDGVNGYLAQMGDEPALCSRVSQILDSDRYHEMAANALDTIRPYTVSHMVRIQTDAIKEILTK